MDQHNHSRLAPPPKPPDWGRLVRLYRERSGEHLSEEQMMKKCGVWDPEPKSKAQKRAKVQAATGAGGPAPLRASRPADGSSGGSTTCRSSGSNLAVGRKESVTTARVNGKFIETTTFRCRCGKGRRIKREVAGPKPETAETTQEPSRPTFACTACGEVTDFPSEDGRCIACEPEPAEPCDPAAHPCFTADFLDAKPLGEWFRRTGREERLKSVSKVFANRISAWVARGGRASEQTVDEMMIELGEHPLAVPPEFWITNGSPTPVAQLSVFETRDELAELMAEAA